MEPERIVETAGVAEGTAAERTEVVAGAERIEAAGAVEVGVAEEREVFDRVVWVVVVVVGSAVLVVDLVVDSVAVELPQRVVARLALGGRYFRAGLTVED